MGVTAMASAGPDLGPPPPKGAPEFQNIETSIVEALYVNLTECYAEIKWVLGLHGRI